MQHKVLIVDDESLIADTLSIIFRKSGFDCQTAYNGDQAVALAEEFSPELMICDVCMPDTDGLDVATAVSRIAPACRILMLTGQYINLSRVHAHFEALPTYAAIVTKPIQPDDLLRQARNLLAQGSAKSPGNSKIAAN
jgi:DNA-binding response OmpR family regulator